MYYEITTATRDDLWALPVEGDRKPILVRRTADSEHNGVLSPDGKWIAYGSDDGGREEVYIQAFPTGSAWPVSSQGGNRPKWSRDGKELFYLSAQRNAIMSAAVRTTGAGVETDAPVQLITLGTPLPNLVSPYDVSADGQRFLVLDPVDQNLAASPLTVVLNWRAGVPK